MRKAPYLLDICPTASRANETGRHQVDKHAKKAVGPMFQKADPDHMLSHGTTYVRIVGGVVANPTGPSPDRLEEDTPNSLSEDRGHEERAENAHRISRSCAGHTAEGRGFRTYQISPRSEDLSPPLSCCGVDSWRLIAFSVAESPVFC